MTEPTKAHREMADRLMAALKCAALSGSIFEHDRALIQQAFADQEASLRAELSRNVTMHLSTSMARIERAYEETRPSTWVPWNGLGRGEQESYERFVRLLEETRPERKAESRGELRASEQQGGEGTFMVDQGSYDKGVYDAMHDQLPGPYSCGDPNCDHCAPSQPADVRAEIGEEPNV